MEMTAVPVSPLVLSPSDALLLCQAKRAETLLLFWGAKDHPEYPCSSTTQFIMPLYGQ